MVDISADDEFEDYYIDSNDEVKPLEFKAPSFPSSMSYSVSSESKSHMDQSKFDFMDKIRKRSAKEREKQSEYTESNKITTSLIEKIHDNKFKFPFMKPPKKDQPVNKEKKLEDMIFKKFHDRKSVSKIVQKTAKLQKNIEKTMLDSHRKFDEAQGESIRYFLNQRIRGVQLYKAQTYTPKQRERGLIHRECLKLKYQYPEINKRKTRIFDMYEERELDFPDANKLLKKKLQEFEFDNDIHSDEDEIAKSSYVRLKDLTISLKEKLNKGDILDNDPVDLDIKHHVGLSEEERVYV